MLPQVIIIGRPNVGKSTLFNRLVGKKLALVDDQPGVTRDRRFGDAELLGLKFQIVDTAGWEDDEAETLPGRMRKQTEAALETADVALFVVDARAGLTPLDEEIGQWLRASTVPVVVLANKAEGRAGESGVLEAYSLGLGDPITFSAEHGVGVADLFESLLPHLEPLQPEEPEFPEEEDEEALLRRPLKLAIVGRPNAGKSTLINRILGEDRLLTGPEAGITRDSITVDWEWTDPKTQEVRQVSLIDTAGMRKRANVTEKLERMAINKWDVAEGPSGLFNGIRGALDEGLAQVRGVPLLAVSARTGKGIDDLIAAGFSIREAWSKRVPTAALNRWFDDALSANPPPAPGGKRIKLRYITQAKTRPPGFVLFGTRLDLLPESYRRYLINGIRRELGFDAVPIRLNLRMPKNPFAK